MDAGASIPEAARLDAERGARFKVRRIALFVSGFGTGGVPRKMVRLSGAFAERGHAVDFVVTRSDGPLRSNLSRSVRLVDLAQFRNLPQWCSARGKRQVLSSIPSLARYLRRARPDVLLAAGNYVNLVATAARCRAGTNVPITLSCNSHLSLEARLKPLIRLTARLVYSRAQAIIAVSDGVADDLASFARIPREGIISIDNPTVTPLVDQLARESLDHPWFEAGAPPVVLGAGRLHPQKDFPTLIRAFARVRAKRNARLVILGGGKGRSERKKLIDLAARLGVAEDISLPGFVLNPLPFMRKAAVFVLSSAWEGFPNVLVEALACGCPVVSTECRSGPREILEDGVFGPLVAVGDDAAMAAAIEATLSAPRYSDRLIDRAREFSLERATDHYLTVLLGEPRAMSSSHSV